MLPSLHLYKISAALAISLLLSNTAFAQGTTAGSDSLRHVASSEVVIKAERPYSAASDQTFRQVEFALRPKNSAQDMLRIVPGLIVAQHAGGGKAEQIFLRGFDVDHGTDINLSVDDAPVNMVSHGHGQGYADLHFIIPETIERLDVSKGPYFARYGDFATAGTVQYKTLDHLDNNLLRIDGGSFSTYRGLVMLHTPQTNGAYSAYGAAEYFGSQSYFDQPQNFTRLNLFGKGVAAYESGSTLTATMFHFSSKWNASGQVPERAITQNIIGRFGSIDPTEGGHTSRTTGIIAYTTGGSSPFAVNATYTKYDFQLFSNFTLFKNDSVRGDEIEQTDHRNTYSVRAEKRMPWMLGDAVMQTRTGINLRFDAADVTLYNDSARMRISPTAIAYVGQQQYGPYLEQEIVLSSFQMMFGLRADYMRFNVENLLKQGTAPHGAANNFVLSPKVNFSFFPSEGTTLFLNSGFGFHSNDARAVVQSKNASGTAQNVPPLARAFGSEIGARTSRGDFAMSGAVWMIALESELVYSGDEGTTEINGRSLRLGVDIEAHYKLTDWLTVGADATVSQGKLRDAPVGEDYIPLAPNFTLTANAVTTIGDASTALRLRHIGNRPANETNSVIAKGYSVVDFSGTYRLGNYELTCSIENVLNVQWNEAQFDTESKLKGESAPISELHFTPGTPRSIRLGLGMKF